MNKKTNNYLYQITAVFLLTTTLFSHSRVAFSRPGSFIRTPSALMSYNVNQYSVGYSNDLIHTKNLTATNSLFFHAYLKNGMACGMAYSKHAATSIVDTSPASEMSFHFTKQVYQNNNFIINVGVQDILFENKYENQISVFMTLINKNIQIAEGYKLQTAIGFGSGRVNNDSYYYQEGIDNNANIFLGFAVRTPFLLNNGGVRFLIDYDGKGLNVGAAVPATKQITFFGAITHAENISKFNQYLNESTEQIYSDSPSISLGLDFKIPQKKKQFKRNRARSQFDIKNTETDNECLLTIEEQSKAPLLVNSDCYDVALNALVENVNRSFQSINDSLILMQQDLDAGQKENLSLEFQTKILQDSINVQYLNQRISQSEMNIGMKYLSKSLKYFYSEEYDLALAEVENAQKYLPNLAYAYARKGSIYYKIGDLDRALVNWNIALQLDPEYSEVRNMIYAVKKERDTEVLSK
tara:strand:+ start:710 stop:2110 length:1401 start_codon:yes stop_codon:yes gene_type:complete